MPEPIEVGQTVEIFQDPVTKLESEGMAVVKSIVRDDPEYTDVMVSFDGEPRSYHRTIWKT